ncbi:MAG: mycothiol synthase [Actinomycetes bacterium]
MDIRIEMLSRLDQTIIHEIKNVISTATSFDDLAPLSEHVLIHINHGGDESDEHLLARDNSGDLIGYLHLDQTDEVAGPVVELVVNPQNRRQGVGTALVQAALTHSGSPLFRLWAHGELISAHSLARSLGFVSTRELWQMRRSLLAPLPRITAPADITMRTFIPGQDEQEWVELNAQVFAEHPEQGQLARRDLDIRMNEKWFDPEGFLIATRDNRMVGFHWTKVHGGIRRGPHDHPEVGEIYVLGVSPGERGTGLAKYLSVKGLEYLRNHNLSAAMLYVDADNLSARALYESIGFSHWDTDVMFQRPIATKSNSR